MSSSRNLNKILTLTFLSVCLFPATIITLDEFYNLVTFYDGPLRSGPFITLKAKHKCPNPSCRNDQYLVHSCQNLPPAWWDRVSSIDTKGHECIVVYPDFDCRQYRGRGIRFYRAGVTMPERVNHLDFRRSWFDNTARSFMICHPSNYKRLIVSK